MCAKNIATCKLSVGDIIGENAAKSCAGLISQGNEIMGRDCGNKKFIIESGRPCPGGSGSTAPVDLVVVIDTSPSMKEKAADMSNAADDAIKVAATKCPSDLRVAWFGIEGTWPGTKFEKILRDYLHGLNIPDVDIKGRVMGSVPGNGPQEDGAAAIADISDHFDWRPGASRAIFYLGDEGLFGDDVQDANDVAAANEAIAVAQTRGVKVFTYYGGVDEIIKAEYARVATETGGQAFAAPVANIGGFQSVLETIICASGGKCSPVRLPTIRPCFVLRWGEGSADHIETDDWEILCISACNPYSNVTIKDLIVVVSQITDAAGNAVPNLPDGTPSVFIKPSYNICFGDIPPCNPRLDRPACVSRELVLISRGAIQGPYKLNITYCYSVEFSFQGSDEFKLELFTS